VVVWKGLTNKVQTYWGLEIAIMAIKPNPNCTHRDMRGAGAVIVSSVDMQ